MKKLFLISLVFIMVYDVVAQDDAKEISNSKLRNNSIDLRIAYVNHNNSTVQVQSGPVSVEVGTSGISGKIIYNYYPNYDYSFFFSIGGMTPKVSVDNISEHSSTIGSLMMGMKYFPFKSINDDTFRPYLSCGMQMLIGTESNVEILNVESHTESAMGVYGSIGTEFLISSRIKFLTEMGYNLVTDFTVDIGNKKNYSGAEFSFGIGFMF
ncbi:MAG: hypothetical protein OQK64_02125 [Ignavibacteriaceae bacterium]|nr:hypothetical protein [Ignavibacteriaceae bacterium]